MLILLKNLITCDQESSRYGKEKWPVTICSRLLLTQESSRYGKELRFAVKKIQQFDTFYPILSLK